MRVYIPLQHRMHNVLALSSRTYANPCIFAQVARMFTFHSHPYILPHPDTERRLLKRINSFFAILRTPEYHVAYNLWSHGLIPSMPWAPDPFDLSVSKRNWEASVQTWRNALKRIARQYAT